jgi:hypothetical protein
MSVIGSLPANWARPWDPDPQVDTGGINTGAHIGLGAATGIATVGTLGMAATWLDDRESVNGRDWAKLGRVAGTAGLAVASGAALFANLREPDDITDGVVQGALLAATVGTGAEAIRALTGDSNRVVSPTVWKNAGKIGAIGGALASEYAVAKPHVHIPDSATDGLIDGAIAGTAAGTILGGARWLGASDSGNKTVPLKVAGVVALNLGMYGLEKDYLKRPDDFKSGALQYAAIGAVTLPAAYIGTRAIIDPKWVTGKPITRTIGLAGFSAFIGVAAGAVAGAVIGSKWPHKEAS